MKISRSLAIFVKFSIFHIFRPHENKYKPILSAVAAHTRCFKNEEKSKKIWGIEKNAKNCPKLENIRKKRS